MLAVLVLSLVLQAPLAASAQAPAATSRLSDVTVSAQPDAVTVHVKTSGAAKYNAELIDSPNRLVIDLESTTYGWRKTALNVNTAPIKQIRGSQYRKGVARVVVELTRRVGYAIREETEGLTIVIPTAALSARSGGAAASTTPAPASAKREAAEPAKPAAPKTASKPAPAKAAAAAPASATAMAKDNGPAMAPAKTESAPIRLAQAQPPAAPAAPSGPRLISFDFKDADVVNLLRILAAESTKNIVISDDVKGKMSISLRNVPWDLALDTILEARSLVKVEKDNVLRIVSADQLTKERESKARVEEAKLKSETELRAKIAEMQLKEQEAQQRKLAAEREAAELTARGPLKEELIRLSYADPEELAKTLQGILGIPAEGIQAQIAPVATAPAVPNPALGQLTTPGGVPPVTTAGGSPPPPYSAPISPSADVLSKGITIRAHRPTNSIFIRHYEADLERIKKLIREKLDVPLPQVKIQARLDEMNRTDLFELGIQWGGAGARRDGRNILVGQGGGVRTGTGIPVTPSGSPLSAMTNPAVTLSGLLPVSATTGLPLGGNLVNFPFSSGGTDFGSIAFGIIGSRININLALQALESQTKTRSLAKPDIVTVENAKAVISLGSEIPYATTSSAGTQIQFREALLRLEVTPTVIQEPNATRVKMKIIVDNNSQGANVVSGGLTSPTINRRRAETEVIVKAGETLVIGGIAQRTDTETVRKVPLFGDIPVIGYLFRSKLAQTDPNRELVVFITPIVLKVEGVASAAPPAAKP